MSAISWTSTPTMAKLQLPSGNVYYLKDSDVRNWVGNGTSSGAEYRIATLEEAVASLSNATHWIGITTTALTDGATTNPITINGESVTAVSGDIVQYNDTEFIFNGTAWQQFGASIGTLGDFAFVDQGVTKSFTPAGSNSSSSVSFTAHTTATVLTSNVSATVPKTSKTTKYLTASASGAAVGASGTDTFVKSYPGATSKLATTTVTPVSSMPSFAMDSTDPEMLVITNGSAGSPVTVATGSLSDNGSGGTVMTGLGTATTGSAVTGVEVTTQPSITLTSGDSTSTGAVTYVSDIGTDGTDSVTFDTSTSGNTASAITALGTATAAAQTFTGTAMTVDVDPKSST